MTANLTGQRPAIENGTDTKDNRWRLSRRQVSAALLATAAATLSGTGAAFATVPDHVDLSADQTPLKSQGGRTTCITFGALAALEAALGRAGLGRLNLSEQFLNHVGKMTWLHPKWNEVVAKGEDGPEGQVGAFAGGGGPDYIEELSKGMKVPEDNALPYVDHNYTAADHPHLANAWDNWTFWRQRRMSDFNLDARFLPRRALTQHSYYSVKSFARVSATDVSAIERVLASHREVVWDFRSVDRGPGATIWQPCGPGEANCPNGSHCMLLIGYDRRDRDSSKHYFLAKNSWGPTAHPGGFTRISYEYVRRNGIAAAYITEVARPAAWPELAFVGRWNLNFDGHHGLLDIYHIPGIAQWRLDRESPRIPDRRIGSFYDRDGRAFRVNGRMTADAIEFYIDARNANARWDQLGGRKFVYSRPTGIMMAGYHTDPDGGVYGGFATQADTFADGSRTPRPLNANAYVGSWHADFLNFNFTGSPPSSGTLRLDRVDNSFLTATERATFDGLSGSFAEAGAGRFEVHALVDKRYPAKIILRLRRLAPAPGTARFEVTAYHLNNTNGIVAGKGTTADYGAGLVIVRH